MVTSLSSCNDQKKEISLSCTTKEREALSHKSSLFSTIFIVSPNE